MSCSPRPVSGRNTSGGISRQIIADRNSAISRLGVPTVVDPQHPDPGQQLAEGPADECRADGGLQEEDRQRDPAGRRHFSANCFEPKTAKFTKEQAIQSISSAPIRRGNVA